MSKILKEVLSANEAYASTFGEKSKLALPPARGFAILTCMDARLDPAKYAGLSEGVVHRPLLALVETQLLIKDDTEEGPRYRAPHEDPRLKYLFLFLRQDSDIVERLARAMKKLKTVQYACVFGSFVTGTTHKGSDIDVLVLENREDERAEVLAAFSALSKVIGREINPEIYSVEEFNANVAKGNSLSLSIASNRIDLKGVATWLK